jgi:tetratricopeptide (TPR) repeat protein
MDIQSPQDLAAEGKQAYTAGDYAHAAEAFFQAAQGFKTAGEHSAWAEMANNQSVALLQAGEAQAALHALAGTPDVFEAQNDALHLAMAYGNRAAAWDALNQVVEAEADYRQAGEIFKALGETELRAELMKSYSALLLRTGRQMEALAVMKTGVDSMEKPGVKGRFLRRLLEIPFKWLK